MRQEGRAKMGFYPCPPRVVDMVASHIILPKPEHHIALVDPCCGQGAAMMLLRDRLGAEQTLTYGVDISPDNAAICRTLPFTKFIQADTMIGIDWPRQQYDMIWFNPPYDWEEENKREENQFFNQLIKHPHRIMKPGALFIGILTRAHMREMLQVLLNMLDGVPNGEGEPQSLPLVFRFPSPEIQDFDQVVIIATIRRRARGIVPEKLSEEWAKLIYADDCPALDFAPKDEEGNYLREWATTFYQGKDMPLEHFSVTHDPEVSAALARRTGWMTRDDISGVLFGRRPRKVQVARPLNMAQVAAAITAGFLDGQVIDGRPEGYHQEIVKGRTRKDLITTQDRVQQPDGSYQSVAVETFHSEVFSLDETGQFHVYRLFQNKNEKPGTTKANGEREYANMKDGQLADWIATMGPALRRLQDHLFPPLVSDTELAKIDISGYNSHHVPVRKQVELIKCVQHQIERRLPGLVIVKQGGGKTLISLYGIRAHMEAAWAKGEKLRTVVVCDKHMLMKWKREAERCIPGVKVLIAESVADLDPNKPRVVASKVVRKGRMTERTLLRRERKADNPHPLDADIIICAYTDISLTARRIPSANVKALRTRKSNGKYTLMLNEKSQIGYRITAENTYRVAHCPTCGQPIMDMAKDGTIQYVSVEQLNTVWRRCNHPRTRLVRDDKNGTVIRSYEGIHPETGEIVRIIRRYSVEIMKDKRGREIKCNTPLWQYTANAPEQPKIVGSSNKTLDKALRDISHFHERGMSHTLEDWKGKVKIRRAGSRDIDLGTYFQRHFKVAPCRQYPNGLKLPIDVVLIDEVHKAKAKESARGISAANIGALARRSVIGLTGTVSGGYSSTMFYLLWRFTPLIRQYFKYDEVGRWIKTFGQLQYSRKAKDPENAGLDVGTRSRRRQAPPTVKEIPGLSPAAYLLFWYVTFFSELAEIFPDLPEYRDIVKPIDLDNTHITLWRVPLLNNDGTPQIDEDTGEMIYKEMPYTQKTAYEYIRLRLEKEAKSMLARGDKGLLAAMLQTLLTFPNLPTEDIVIHHPRTKQVIVEFPGLRGDVLYPKERRLLQQVVEDAKAGHKSLIFVTHTGVHDVLARLDWVMGQAEVEFNYKLNTAVLRSGDVDAADRETWINRRVEGSEKEPAINVLLCNPRLVDTGLDLVAFSRTHFVEVDYSIFVTAQAARRTYRPGQTKNVNTFYWVYNGALETGAVKLMAAKAKELAKISGSDLNEALMQQAGPMNLQEMLTLELTKTMSTDGLAASTDDIQAEFDSAGAIYKEQQEAVALEARAKEIADDGMMVIELNPKESHAIAAMFGGHDSDETTPLPANEVSTTPEPQPIDISNLSDTHLITDVSVDEETGVTWVKRNISALYANAARAASRTHDPEPESEAGLGPQTIAEVQVEPASIDWDIEITDDVLPPLSLDSITTLQENSQMFTSDGALDMPGTKLEETPGDVSVITNIAGISRPKPQPTWDELKQLRDAIEAKKRRKKHVA